MTDSDSRVTGAMQGIAAESGRSTGSAMKGSGMAEEGGITELYKVNQVWYRLPPSLSLVAKRTFVVNQFQKTSYGATDQLTCIFNTGEYYASMPTSWMYVECGWNSNTASYAGVQALISTGNIATLIEEVVFMSASGTEVCREQNKGLKEAFTFRYCHNQHYVDTYGQAQGAPLGSYSKLYDGVAPTYDYGFSNGTGGFATSGTIAGADPRSYTYGPPTFGQMDVGMLTFPRSGTRAKDFYGYGASNINTYDLKTAAGNTVGLGYTAFLIPMNQILGLFNPYLASLTPAGLLAGGRLDIRLKQMAEAIQFVSWTQAVTAADTGTAPAAGTVLTNPNLNNITTDVNKFTINKVYCLIDAYQMQDAVLRRLNQIAAGQDGLSLMFDTYDYASAIYSGFGSVEAQVNQARSRIIRSICIIRDTAQILNPYINSYAAEAAVNRVAGLIGPGAASTSGFLQPNVTTPSPKSGVGGIMMMVGTGTALNGGVNNGFITIIPQMPADPTGGTTYGPNIYGTPIVSSYQAQLGSLFFPQQPLTTPVEQYANALLIFGNSMADKDKNCCVSYEDFLGGLGYGLYGSTIGGGVVSTTGQFINPYNYTYSSSGVGGGAASGFGPSGYGKWVAPYGMAIYGMLAEKNQTLQLSGLPISNARLLRHRITFSQGPQSQTSRTISVFTWYTRVCKVFLGGRVVVRE